IVHRDIRLENIFIIANETAKIANFSFSRQFIDKSRILAISLQTVCYTASEILYRNTNKYNTKCEVYSFGILLLELAEQKIPYKNLDDIIEIKNHVDKEKYQELYTNYSNLLPTITEMFKALKILQDNFCSLRLLTFILYNDNIKVTEVINFAEFNYMTIKEATLVHRINNGNLEIVFKCFNAYAKSGNLKAKYFVGYYLFKKLVNTSYTDKEREKHAAQLFKEVANSGNEVLDAQLKYRLYLFQRIDVDRDFSEAAKYFQKAAKNGLAVGMYNVGNMLYVGLTDIKDEKLGIKYIRKITTNLIKAKQNIEVAQGKQKEYYDEYIKKKQFYIGNKVLLYQSAQTKVHGDKFHEKWK
ncbi:1028_t:CDS:2, partial [Scutellospora calospora]